MNNLIIILLSLILNIGVGFANTDQPTRIEPYPIYLGSPLTDDAQLQELTDLNVSWIITLTDLPPEWQQTPMIIDHILTTGTQLTPEMIKRGVDSLFQALKQDRTVYTESGAIVIAYLMQSQTIPYDDAFALVQTWHPTLSLDPEQTQAISDYFSVVAKPSEESQISWAAAIQDTLTAYFQDADDVTDNKLAQTLDILFYYAVEGFDVSEVPPSVAEWLPPVSIESTLSRRDRYLSEFLGNQEQASAEAINRNQTHFRKMQLMILGLVPFVGSPASYSMNLWYQLREICLIAALHGHDLYDPEVKIKVMSALVGSRVINAAVGKITKVIAREILVTAGAAFIPGAAITIPFKFAFNYFTDNATKVGEHALVLFAGEHSRAIATNP